MAETRMERDSMGAVVVSTSVLWGASTQRAIENFSISGTRMPLPVIHAMARIKMAAAEANAALGELDERRAALIRQAAWEVAEGRHDREFPLDCFQTGSGTSTNMNLNEVIANRAAQIAGLPIGTHDPIHPNDHANRGQSSNDVFPSALHLAGALAIRDELIGALEALARALRGASLRLADVITIARTHLQDATPISYGQVFAGYATQIERGIARAAEARGELCELPLGGTAVGTGIGRHPGFATRVIALLAANTALPLREAADHCEAGGARDSMVSASGRLVTIAVSLSRIANDLRLRGSGPRGGLGDLVLPAVQPGSSLMPGKVNPVISEAVIQACVQVLADDTALRTAALGGIGGLLELNVAMPLMGRALLDAIALLARSARALAERCVAGIDADRARCALLVDTSLAAATALVTDIGYDAAARIAQQAAREGTSIRAVALAQGVLSPERLAELLDARRMLAPG
jgi:fumarate hydratase class II